MASRFPSGRPLFSLLEDALISADEHRLTVHGRWGDVDVADDNQLVREALRRMSMGPVVLENIPVLSAEAEQWRATGVCGPQWRRLKRTLDQLGGLVVPSLGLRDEASPILSLVPVVGDAVFRWPQIADTALVETTALARIEYIDGDQTLVCPGPPYVGVLHRPPAIGIADWLLGRKTTITELAETLAVDREVVADVIAYLASASLVRTGATEEN